MIDPKALARYFTASIYPSYDLRLADRPQSSDLDVAFKLGSRASSHVCILPDLAQ